MCMYIWIWSGLASDTTLPGLFLNGMVKDDYYLCRRNMAEKMAAARPLSE